MAICLFPSSELFTIMASLFTSKLSYRLIICKFSTIYLQKSSNTLTWDSFLSLFISRILSTIEMKGFWARSSNCFTGILSKKTFLNSLVPPCNSGKSSEYTTLVSDKLFTHITLYFERLTKCWLKQKMSTVIVLISKYFTILLVIPERLEPPTFWSVVRCSIH